MSELTEIRDHVARFPPFDSLPEDLLDRVRCELPAGTIHSSGRNQVVQQIGVGLADGFDAGRLAGHDFGGEEALSVGPRLALAVAAVRGDPVDARADGGGAFDVRFFVGGGAKEVRQIQRGDRHWPVLAVIAFT